LSLTKLLVDEDGPLQIPRGMVLEKLPLQMIKQADLGEGSLFALRFNKANTEMYYAQKKFNLFREENEGFSKALTLIASIARESHDNLSPTQRDSMTSSSLFSLIGEFKLDPNRILDVLLDALIAAADLQPSLSILAHFNRTHLLNLLGLKIQKVSEVMAKWEVEKEKEREKEKEKENPYPGSALFVTLARLTHLQIVSIPDILEWCSPAMDTMPALLDAYCQLVERNCRRTGLSTSATSGGSAEGQTMSMSISASVGVASALRDIAANETPCLLYHLTSTGAFLAACCMDSASEAWQLLGEGRAIRLAPVAMVPAVEAALLHQLRQQLTPLMRGGFPDFTWPTIVKEEAEASTSTVTATTALARLLAPNLIRLCLCSGTALAADPALFQQYLTALYHYGKEIKRSEEWTAFQQPLATLLAEAFLPSLACLPGNGQCAHDVWCCLSLLPSFQRHLIYQQFRRLQREHPQLQVVDQGVGKESKRLMRRLTASSTQMKSYAMILANLSLANPLSLCQPIMEQIQTYPGTVAATIVDCFQHASALTRDVLMFLLVEKFSTPEEELPKRKSDGLHLAEWFANAVVFAGLFGRKYPSTDIQPLLRYLCASLRDGAYVNVHLLSALLLYMGEVEVMEDLSPTQLKLLGNGPHLLGRIIPRSIAMTVRGGEAEGAPRSAGTLLPENGAPRPSSLNPSQQQLFTNLAPYTPFLLQALEAAAVNVIADGGEDDVLSSCALIDRVQQGLVGLVRGLALVGGGVPHEGRGEGLEESGPCPLLPLGGEGGKPRLHGPLTWAVARTHPSHDPLGPDTPLKSDADADADADAELLSGEKDLLCPQRFLSHFWRLTLHDIAEPAAGAYAEELKRLKVSANSHPSSSSNNNNNSNSNSNSSESGAGSAEREQEKREKEGLIRVLKEELAEHKLHQKRVCKRLRADLPHWFTPPPPHTPAQISASLSFIHTFVDRCLWPRIMFSTEDALFCATFLTLPFQWALQSSRTANTPQIVYPCLNMMQAIVDSFPGYLASSTEKEARRMGVFLSAWLEGLIAWDPKANYAGVSMLVDLVHGTEEEKHEEKQEETMEEAEGEEKHAAPVASNILDWPKIENVRSHSIKYLLATLLQVLQHSEEYLTVRNALSVLQALSGVLPLNSVMWESVKERMEAFRQGEEREGLKLVATSYLAGLMAKKESFEAGKLQHEAQVHASTAVVIGEKLEKSEKSEKSEAPATESSSNTLLGKRASREHDDHERAAKRSHVEHSNSGRNDDRRYHGRQRRYQ
jgi:THO complex subunit 2